jgi:CHAT domain-containing protein/tetratricopeptide (TPR) repeat protein
VGTTDRSGTQESGFRRGRGCRRWGQTVRRLAAAVFLSILLLNGCGRLVQQSAERLYSAADQARRRGELTAALELTEQGIRQHRNLRDSTWSLKFHLLKTEILLTLNRTAEARPLIDRAPAEISQSAELKPRLLVDMAELQNQLGQPEEARKLLDQARDIASHAESPLLAWIELRRGILMTDFDESDAALRRSVDIATREHDQFLAASALVTRGYIRLDRFRYDDAVPFLEAADRAAQQIPSKILHERSLGNLGWCSFRLGQPDRALDLLSKAERLAAEINLKEDQQLWLGDIGVIYYARDAFDKAISYYSQAAKIARELGNKTYVANWLNNITRANIDQKNWDAAEKWNRQALDAAADRSVAQWVQAYSRLNTGFIADAHGHNSEAGTNFRAAIRLAQAASMPNVVWQAHSGLAVLYSSRGQAGAAENEYAAAMDVLDREWLALSRDESKITFRGYLAGVYQEYVGFLSLRGRKQKALEVAESSRARLLAQKLEGRSTTLPHFRAADGMRLARKTNSIVLSYWLAPERSYVWAVTPTNISQFVLPGEAEIAALIEQHRRAIQGLEDLLSSENTAARQLYKTLLAPAEPLFHSAAQVIIVPDGRLHELNFETLVVASDKPHYWIEDAAIAVTPSLSVLHLEKSEPSHRRRLLIIGDPLPADDEFPPLPHLKKEIHNIAAGFAETERAVYTGDQAYAAHFREMDPSAFNAIHFAAHASANEESPLHSAIILSPHDGNYKLFVSEVAGLRLHPELVTISACRSAGAKAYSGEGLIGFAWAFLEAGAHNVVAGIWNVDDLAAPMIMEEFYKDWQAGDLPVSALRKAKLKLIRSGGAFRKPYYWGPFELFTCQASPQATRSAIDLAWRNSSR